MKKNNSVEDQKLEIKESKLVEVTQRVSERERERERERDSERQRDRETERQREIVRENGSCRQVHQKMMEANNKRQQQQNLTRKEHWRNQQLGSGREETVHKKGRHALMAIVSIEAQFLSFLVDQFLLPLFFT